MRTRQILCKYCFRITCIFYFVLFYAKTMRPSVKRAYSHISMQWYRKQDVMRAFSAGSFDYKVVSGADIHFLIEKQWIYFLNVWNKSSNGNDNDKKTFWFEIQDVCRRDRVWSAWNEAWREKQQIFFRMNYRKVKTFLKKIMVINMLWIFLCEYFESFITYIWITSIIYLSSFFSKIQK